MAHRIINDARDLAHFVQFLGNLKLPVTVEWVQGRDRTAEQNKLMWMWATEAAHQLGDRTASEIQHDWKLRHGVPILREDSAEFRDFYDKALKHLPFELKVSAMEYVPVTSQMKVRQMVRFMDTVQRECLSNGIYLTEPDPELRAYQARYRSRETLHAA